MIRFDYMCSGVLTRVLRIMVLEFSRSIIDHDIIFTVVISNFFCSDGSDTYVWCLVMCIWYGVTVCSRFAVFEILATVTCKFVTRCLKCDAMVLWVRNLCSYVWFL